MAKEKVTRNKNGQPRKTGSGSQPIDPKKKRLQFQVYVPKFVLDKIERIEAAKADVKAMLANLALCKYDYENDTFTS